MKMISTCSKPSSFVCELYTTFKPAVINILQVLRFPALFGDYSWTSYRLSLINRLLHNECFPKGTYIKIAEYSSPERQILAILPKSTVRDITV